MANRGYLADVWCFFKPVILIDLGVFALVWLLMLLAGWSIQEYLSALQWSGVLILAAGALALTGGSDISRNAASPFLRGKDVKRFTSTKEGEGDSWLRVETRGVCSM